MVIISDILTSILRHSGKAFLTISFTAGIVATTFAQNYSFTHPEKLPPTVNSDAEESMPVLNASADTLYFVRSLYQGNNGGKTAGQDIWMSTRNSNSWSAAANNLPSLNNHRNNAVIGIDSSGSVLYLLDTYSPPNPRINGVSKSKHRGRIFTEPSTIKIKGIEARNSFVGFYMNSTEDALLISMHGNNSLGEEDLYVSLKDETGEWSTPINLGPTINTEGFEISPFLSKDGKTLFFASNGHDGYGDADIFMSTRLYNNSWVLWSKPVNLGEQINSEGFDAYFFMTEDQEDVFFASNRSDKNTDIYTASVIKMNEEELRAEINPSKYKLTETEIQALLGMPVTRTVYFDFGSFEIKQSSKELLNFLVEKLKENRDYNIELIGHTDNEGSDDFNMELSRRRANEIEKYFLDSGIGQARISTKGVGKTRLLYEKGTEDEIARNRRVEIFFTKEQEQ